MFCYPLILKLNLGKYIHRFNSHSTSLLRIFHHLKKNPTIVRTTARKITCDCLFDCILAQISQLSKSSRIDPIRRASIFCEIRYDTSLLL